MKRILLVDDDFLSLNAFYALTDWNRIGVQIAYEAHNGREALEYMEKTEAKPDAAFIDVCMPDMDGIVLLQQFRKRYPQSFVLCSAVIRIIPMSVRPSRWVRRIICSSMK